MTIDLAKSLQDAIDNPLIWQDRFGKQAKELHADQYNLAVHPAKEKIACWGRRGGKSIILGENDIPRWALSHPDTTQWILSLTQDQANIIFEYMAAVIVDSPIELLVDDIKWSPWPQVIWKNGARVMARNLGRDGRHVRGRGGDRLIIDESAYVRERTLSEAVFPMIAASSYAEIVQTSTPNGLNHFWKSYQRGLPGDSNTQSFHMPSWKNPFLSRRYLIEQERKRTSLAWRVEYGAEFVDEQNAVFLWSVIEQALDEELVMSAPYCDGHNYVLGWDPASVHDRSGLVALDITSLPWQVVDVQDIAGPSWTTQMDRVSDMAEKYGGAGVLMDATSMGDPLFETLKDRGVQVSPFRFTNQSKRELIDGLVLVFEQGDVKLPHHDDLLSELKFYRRDVSRAGTVTLGAAEGEYDDLVTALALAVREAGGGAKLPFAWMREGVAS